MAITLFFPAPPVPEHKGEKNISFRIKGSFKKNVWHITRRVSRKGKMRKILPTRYLSDVRVRGTNPPRYEHSNREMFDFIATATTVTKDLSRAERKLRRDNVKVFRAKHKIHYDQYVAAKKL
jgi:hypothetical protein